MNFKPLTQIRLLLINFIKIFFLVVFLILSIKSNGQNTHSRITILAGGSATFPFNSLVKMNNGISYTNWTRLSIFFLDTLNDGSVDATANWRLLIRANTATIDGDGGGSMSLDKVELSVTTTSGTAVVGWYTITAADFAIVTGGANPSNTAQVDITYRVGGTAANRILGENFDFYFVDLVYTLERQP